MESPAADIGAIAKSAIRTNTDGTTVHLGDIANIRSEIPEFPQLSSMASLRLW